MIATRFEELLPTGLKIHTLEIIETLQKAGFEAYLVGGCVRDLLLGHDVKDIDIATNARPERVQSLFKRTVPTGIKHGTITVLIGKEGKERKKETFGKRDAGELAKADVHESTKNNESLNTFEVTTYRSESGYSDG